MIEHVFFDNDGTLVDTEYMAVKATLHMLAPYGFSMSESAFSQRFTGLLERDIAAIIQAENGFTLAPDYFDQLRALHLDLFAKQLVPVKGVADLLSRITMSKSIVSNASRQHVERCLDQTNLSHYINGHIFSAEQVARPKPDPDVYLLALETCGLKPEHVLVVEDSITGVKAALAAGIKTIGFLGASHIYDDHGGALSALGVTYLASDTSELESIFKKYDIL